MSDQFGTSCIEGLSNINYNGKNNEKKLENAGGWGGGISKNMGGNIRCGNFPGGIHQGGFLLVEIFRVGAFLIPKKIYAKSSEVYMHGH